ncbi:hypothetical protein HPP92_020815 [Vanilla planifolia]|uniref:Protein BCCIP homolog n=1 Tax=Vanilla planifolia TaxID=51239 RepID=A0A835Q0Q1_VANPL|nr:hypothetical protein HPP92_020815 [Vanilla planifolia]
MENKEPLIETAELQVSMENFREDKKAKMKKKSKESENKTRELEFCKDKFSEDKAKQISVCQQDCWQSEVLMVQHQQREKSRLPSNLPTFSAFSRVLYFVGSSSVTKARPSKRPVKENGVLEHPAKIRRPESSSLVSDGKEQHQQEEVIVQVDFAFFDPKPADFHGVKLLLQSYLDDKPWDLSGFVDLILGQPTVGTIVKLDARDEDCGQDGDDGDNEDIYGVITVLNLGRYSDHQCIVELREFLLSVCGDENMKMKLKVLLEQDPSRVGLLVSQRFVNCPNELVPPLYDALFDEVSWATEDEPTEKLRNSFHLKFYLLVTRIYELKHAKQCNAKTKLDCDEPIIYLKAEDEIFHEMSLFSFTFPLHASQFVPHELKNYRSMGLIMIINVDAVPKFREKLKSLLAENFDVYYVLEPKKEKARPLVSKSAKSGGGKRTKEEVEQEEDAEGEQSCSV